MKYEITRSCGCVETVQIYGTNAHGERERKAARLAARPCDKCRAEAARNQKGRARLDGTDRQASWAADIREGMVGKMERYRDGFEQGSTAYGEIGEAVENAKACGSSGWLIDNRFRSAAGLVRAALAKEWEQ